MCVWWSTHILLCCPCFDTLLFCFLRLQKMIFTFYLLPCIYDCPVHWYVCENDMNYDSVGECCYWLPHSTYKSQCIHWHYTELRFRWSHTTTKQSLVHCVPSVYILAIVGLTLPHMHMDACMVCGWEGSETQEASNQKCVQIMAFVQLLVEIC